MQTPRVGGLADAAGEGLSVPLDRQGKWYRYHRLFRDMLLAELDREEPALIPVLRRRAADWCLDNDLAEEALEYSIAAGDVDGAARRAEERWLQVLMQGRGATLHRWIQWLDDRGGVEEHPMVAVAATAISGPLSGPGACGTDGMPIPCTVAEPGSVRVRALLTAHFPPSCGQRRYH